MITNSNIGGRLNHARKSLEKTQGQMAAIIGINRTSMSHYENGGKIPKSILNALQDKFKINLIWLETGKGDMFLSKYEDPVAKANSSNLIMETIDSNDISPLVFKYEIEKLWLRIEGLERLIEGKDKIIYLLEQALKRES